MLQSSEISPSPRLIRVATNSISIEDLVRNWNLSGEELVFISRFRVENRSWASFCLCLLRTQGRLLAQDEPISFQIASWLNKILDLPLHEEIRPPLRDATRSKIVKDIVHFLGYREFQDKTESDLRQWILEKVCSGDCESKVRHELVPLLKKWKVVLPASYKLDRVFNSIWEVTSEKVFDIIAKSIDEKTKINLDAFIAPPKDSRQSDLFSLKTEPKKSTPETIKKWIQKYDLLKRIDITKIDLSSISNSLASDYARYAREYDIKALRRFKPEKRHSLLACFIVKNHRRILDQSVRMDDNYLTAMLRTIRKNFDEMYLEKSKKESKSRKVLRSYAVMSIDTLESQGQITIDNVQNIDQVKDALKTTADLVNHEERGFLELSLNRYPFFRRYYPSFVELPIEAAGSGSQNIIEAIKILRSLNHKSDNTLPSMAPTNFLREPWKKAFLNAKSSEKRRIWEIGLAYQIKERLCSGDIFLKDSSKYQPFWEKIDRFDKEKTQIELNDEAEKVKKYLIKEYQTASNLFLSTLDNNTFVSIEAGSLKFHKDPAKYKDPKTQALRSAIHHSLPDDIGIEKILEEVDRLINFSGTFIEMSRQRGSLNDQRRIIRAAILAQATNIGVSGMVRSTTGINSSSLADCIRECIYPEAIKKVIDKAVEFHMQLPFSKYYGDGSVSSSDGQRFPVRASSIETGFCTRYYGYYKKAVNIYTHLADHFGVFSSQILPANGNREAIANLNGLLTKGRVVNPHIHTTDTHGYTDHIFAITYMLGITFAPRLKDLKKSKLYRIKELSSCDTLNNIATGIANLDEVVAQWGDMTRVVSALKHGHILATDIMPKLKNGKHISKLSKSFSTLGDIVKTIFLFRYMSDPKFRSIIRHQLNKGEHRHALAEYVCFANKGELRSGDWESLMSQSSCLALVCNAILIWNTIQYEKIIYQLKTSGMKIDEKCIPEISPLAFKHIGITGHYDFVHDDNWEVH